MLVRDADLVPPEVDVPLGPYTIDFLWQDQRVAVETDGGASHNRASARQRDSRRAAWLVVADFRPLEAVLHCDGR